MRSRIHALLGLGVLFAWAPRAEAGDSDFRLNAATGSGAGRRGVLFDESFRPRNDLFRDFATQLGFVLAPRNASPAETLGHAPETSPSLVDATGDIVLYYRKLHPWVPVEPWHPGDLGIPVCDGPAGSKIALIICHDGMFPEMAREAAYKGANVMLRTAGYTAPMRHGWKITNQHNSFSNLMYTVNVCLAGTDGMFRSMGEGSIINFDGTVLVEGGGFPDEVITSEIVPARADEARIHWGVENNVYQLGHRGYAAVAGGAGDVRRLERDSDHGWRV